MKNWFLIYTATSYSKIISNSLTKLNCATSSFKTFPKLASKKIYFIYEIRLLGSTDNYSFIVHLLSKFAIKNQRCRISFKNVNSEYLAKIYYTWSENENVTEKNLVTWNHLSKKRMRNSETRLINVQIHSQGHCQQFSFSQIDTRLMTKYFLLSINCCE